jgi:GH18 family chitinase
MSYDMNGLWNAKSQYVGDYLLGLTNLTEISEGFDLLWRNNISPDKVVMGMAFYGRTYTMTEGDCYGTNCQFSGAGTEGDCTQTPGIFNYPGELCFVPLARVA